jgi:dihydroorotase
VVHPLVELAVQGGAHALGPMPNTQKGLMTAGQVTAYLAHARQGVPSSQKMCFVGIVQITEKTTKADIDACIDAGILDAKVYPKGRTTQSHNGVAHYGRILDVVRHAGTRGMRAHFHPEHPGPYDNRDAEFAFLPIVDIFLNETETTIFWEHGTDGRCIPHWEEWAKSGRFYVTLTAHHLVENENGAYGDVQATCKPPYKREDDRRALVDLVGKGHAWVMAGGDDAPHPKERKHVIGPCACGAYTAPFLLPLYAHALGHLLETPGGIKVFTKFTSGIALNIYKASESFYPYVDLVKKSFRIPLSYQIGPWEVEPFWAGREIMYSLEETK